MTPRGTKWRTCERPIRVPVQRRLTAPTWLFHVSFLSKVTPRFLTSSQGTRLASRKVTLKFGRLRRFWRFPKTISWILFALTLSAFALNQVSRDAREFSRLEMSAGSSFLLPETSTWVSSPNCSTLASAAYNDRSLANTENSNGPRTEPWNTPMEFGSGGEARSAPLPSRRDTLCVWPDRYVANHWVSMPYMHSLLSSTSWSITSKHLLISIRHIREISPLSAAVRIWSAAVTSAVSVEWWGRKPCWLPDRRWFEES